MGKANSARRFPASYRALTPASKRAWLAGGECNQLLADGRLQMNQVAAELRRLEGASRDVRRKVPSPACHEHYERTGLPFPPPAENTPMVRAEQVLRPSDESQVFWPRYYVRDGATFDVQVLRHEQAMRDLDIEPPHSATAVALEAMEIRGTTLGNLIELKTEDTEVLRQQIGRYMRGEPTNLLID